MYPLRDFARRAGLAWAWRGLILAGMLACAGCLASTPGASPVRDAGTVAATPTPEAGRAAANTPTGSEGIRVLWSYAGAGEASTIFGPAILPNGYVYLPTEDNVYLVINPDGVLETSIVIDPLPTANPNGFLYQPIISPDGVVTVVSAGLMYGIGQDGTRLWEESIDYTLYGHPAASPDGLSLYVASTQGDLYRYDVQTGLAWKFETNLTGASTPTIASDGTVYYTVTNNTVGFVQAVSPEGAELWRTSGDSSYFYDRLRVSASGEYVFMDDDVFDADTGQLLDVGFDVDVTEFIAGEDGLDYLRSLHVLMQWEVGPEGVEIVQAANWNHDNFPNWGPAYARVGPDHTIWMYYVQETQTIVHMTPDGTLLATLRLPYTMSIVNFDLANSIIVLCGSPLDEQTAPVCRGYSGYAETYEWEILLPSDAPIFQGYWLVGNILYGITADNEIYAMEFPGLP